MEKVYELSQEQINYYEEKVHQFCSMFSLYDWLVQVEAEELEIGVLGECRYDYTAKACVILINTKWTVTEPNNRRIERVAYHEVLELLLCSLECILQDESLTNMQKLDFVESERHSIIRRMENAFLGTKM